MSPTCVPTAFAHLASLGATVGASFVGRLGSASSGRRELIECAQGLYWRQCESCYTFTPSVKLANLTGRLYGATSIQTITFFWNYRQDACWLKITVWLPLFLTVAS